MNKLILGCLTLLFSSAAAIAADVPALAQACVACHGKAGVSSNPDWPNIAGQKAGYLEVQLKAFRDGQRSNPVMMPFVKNLSDSDITELAEFYAGQSSAKSANGDASLIVTGENLSAYCKACHGMTGKPVAGVWPNLAGQQARYLQTQLRAYKSGQRVHAHMQTVLKPFGDAEFAALAAYYSQLQP